MVHFLLSQSRQPNFQRFLKGASFQAVSRSGDGSRRPLASCVARALNVFFLPGFSWANVARLSVLVSGNGGENSSDFSQQIIIQYSIPYFLPVFRFWVSTCDPSFWCFGRKILRFVFMRASQKQLKRLFDVFDIFLCQKDGSTPEFALYSRRKIVFFFFPKFPDAWDMASRIWFPLLNDSSRS